MIRARRVLPKERGGLTWIKAAIRQVDHDFLMSKHSSYHDLPLVYSCSGCSSAAQLANHVALRLDREQVAEMSCIAGVGGDVESLVKTAKSERAIVALDGCLLNCVKNTLQRHGVTPALHYTLSEFGVRKRYHADFDPKDGKRVFDQVVQDLLLREATPEFETTDKSSDSSESRRVQE